MVGADGRPAVSVSVSLHFVKRFALTDNQGAFVINHLHPAQDTLIVSSINTAPVLIPVSLQQGEVLDLGIIQLQDVFKPLQKVEITGRPEHSYKSNYSFFGTKTQSPVKDLPQSISTVTKEVIHDKMEFTLKEAVDVVAGVNQYSGYDEYTIRGFRAENARDINGLRGYNTTYTSPMLVNIERVEVIKGPTATLYGNCDPGGTINLVTKKPLDQAGGSLDLYYGSYDHYRAMGDITGPLNKSKTLLYRLNAGYDNTNSFRDNQFGKSYQIAPSVSFVPNDRLRINFDFSVSNMHTMLDRGQPGPDGDPNLKATRQSLITSQPGDYLRETDLASILSVSYKITDRLSFSTGYLNYHTREKVADHGFNSYIQPDSINLSFTKFRYNTNTNTISSYFTYTANTGKVSHQLLAGYDFVKTNISLNQDYYENADQFGVGSGIVGTMSLNHPQYFKRPVEAYTVSDFDDDATGVDGDIYHSNGFYIQDQLSWKRWKLLVSLREELYKGDDVSDSASDLSEHVFLPRVGLVYALTPNISVYGTYNKGFDPFEVSTDAQRFSQPFRPITSQLYEAGVKGSFFRNRLSATLAVYQLTVENVAVNANDPSQPDLFVQQGQNRSRGVETELSGNILPSLSLMISYAYNVAEITKSKDPSQIGMLAENAPKNSSGSWIKYVFNHGWIRGFGIAAGHSLVGERATLEPDVSLPGYLLINGGLSYSYKRYSVAFNVNNLTNRVYWSGAYNNINKWPGAPRNCMVNLGFKF